MIRVRYMLACLLVILPGTVLAQQRETIEINGRVFWLGMSQSEVLAKLKETSTVWESFENHYCAQAKDHVRQRDCSASVYFVNDKLYSAMSEFGFSADTTTATILNRLYTAISQAEKSGKPVRILAGGESELAQTSQRMRTLQVLIGSKLYSIIITQPVGIPGPSFTSVQEEIYDTPQPTTPK
jgi:hypothetical protein